MSAFCVVDRTSTTIPTPVPTDEAGKRADLPVLQPELYWHLEHHGAFDAVELVGHGLVSGLGEVVHVEVSARLTGWMALLGVSSVEDRARLVYLLTFGRNLPGEVCGGNGSIAFFGNWKNQAAGKRWKRERF